MRRAALPVALAVFSVVGTFGASRGQTDRHEPDLLMVVLLLIGSLSLYWLWTKPIPVLWATVLSTLVYMLREYPWGPVVFAFVIAVFTTIRLGHRLAGWLGLITLYVGHVGGRMILGINEQGIYQVLLVGTCFCVLGFLAELFRAHRDRVMAAARTRKEEELRRAGEERLRIAQELHDEVGQTLTAVLLQLSRVEARLPIELRGERGEAQEAARESLEDVRRIAADLRPETLNDLGLASALAALAFSNASVGVCHALAHAFGARFGVPHGRANALLLPHVIAYNAAVPTKFMPSPHQRAYVAHKKYATVADLLGLGGETVADKVQRLIAATERLLDQVGIPRSIADLGISREEFARAVPELAEIAFDDPSWRPTNPRVPLINELAELLWSAYEGRPKASDASREERMAAVCK